MADIYDIYAQEYTENGYDLVFHDIYSTNWADFDFTSGYEEHTITSDDTLRPYMIAYSRYGVMDYWKVLYFINGVDDILNLQVGDKIKVPFRDNFLNYISAKKAENQI